jgi:hypothetical protein
MHCSTIKFLLIQHGQISSFVDRAAVVICLWQERADAKPHEEIHHWFHLEFAESLSCFHDEAVQGLMPGRCSLILLFVSETGNLSRNVQEICDGVLCFGEIDKNFLKDQGQDLGRSK